MTIKDNLKKIQEKIEKAKTKNAIKQKTQIIAVTKSHPFSCIKECYEAGIRSIGENKIQEATEKFLPHPEMPLLNKRFIGHLQTNKINKCLGLFDSIDSVDSIKLSKKINKKAHHRNLYIPVLLEVNTTREPQKHGFLPEEIDKMLECFVYQNLNIQGLMTIAPARQNEKEIRKSFKLLRATRDTLNKQKPIEHEELKELSMGMSNDFEVAVEEGSTQVRIGTAILGKRSPS
tara:strand:- start:150 stop:845 length:696 start_codon:yes stop_codon:yes gene_type:complete